MSQDKSFFDEIIWATKPLEFPKIKPSGTTSFILEFGQYRITLIKNEIMGDGYAILSPDIYEKIYEHFNKLNSEQNPERSVATKA